MLEESIPAAWASLNSWFTPTLLFVFLNLMIGTIAIASGVGTPKQQAQDQQPPHNQLARSPSVLQRIKSFNFYSYRSQESTPFSSVTTTTLQPPEPDQTQHVLDSFHELTNPHLADFEPEPENESETETPYHNLDEHHDNVSDLVPEPGNVFETGTPYHNLDEHLMTRTVSDTNPASGAKPVKLSRKMKKSASMKSAFAHFEEEEMMKLRPATVREGKKELQQSFGDDDEVDAKADDFINKFKQQLKLQRIDSILRYKEMLGRGADK